MITTTLAVAVAVALDPPHLDDALQAINEAAVSGWDVAEAYVVLDDAGVVIAVGGFKELAS